MSPFRPRSGSGFGGCPDFYPLPRATLDQNSGCPDYAAVPITPLWILGFPANKFVGVLVSWFLFVPFLVVLVGVLVSRVFVPSVA